MKVFGQNSPEIAEYAERLLRPEDKVLKEIRARCRRRGLPPIQVAPTDALHLETLTRALGARKAVEIGTLGGYSGVCLCRGMGPQGRLYTFEYEPLHAEVAQESFRKAGVAKRVGIFVGDARENLKTIERQGPFDLVFIDADKPSYPFYLSWAAKNLRVGGCVIADNTFAWGMIARQKIADRSALPAVRGLRAYNRLAARSSRFRTTILPTGEGMTLSVKLR